MGMSGRSRFVLRLSPVDLMCRKAWLAWACMSVGRAGRSGVCGLHLPEFGAEVIFTSTSSIVALAECLVYLSYHIASAFPICMLQYGHLHRPLPVRLQPSPYTSMLAPG